MVYVGLMSAHTCCGFLIFLSEHGATQILRLCRGDSPLLRSLGRKLLVLPLCSKHSLLVVLGALLRGVACAALLWLHLAASTASRAPPPHVHHLWKALGHSCLLSPADGASLGSFHLSILHAEQSPRAYWTLGIFKFFWSYFENTLKICWIFLNLGIGREWESRV